MDKRLIVPGPSSAEIAKALTMDGPPELTGFSRVLLDYGVAQSREREQAEQARELRKAAGRAVVEGFREQLGRDPSFSELRAGVEHVVKSLAAGDDLKGKPTLAEIMRGWGTTQAAIADAKARRKGGEQKGQAPEPPRPRYSFVPAYGQLIEGKLPDGRTAYAKVVDWGAGGVTAVVNDRGDFPFVRIPWPDVRPVGPHEQERLRRERAEREDRDQEQAGVVTSRYTAEDLMRGMRVTCVGDDEEPVTGRILSVQPKGPHAHVVIRAGRPPAGRVPDPPGRPGPRRARAPVVARAGLALAVGNHGR